LVYCRSSIFVPFNNIFFNITELFQALLHQILIIQKTRNIFEHIFEFGPDDEVDDKGEMDWAGLFWLFSICSWFCISFSGSSFPGGNKKHCSPLRLGVVVPCHGEGSGMTLPSQCTQPLGRSPSVWCSGKPDIKLASGTHGIIVPTGMSDNEVVGSKGSENLEWVNFFIHW